MATDIDIVNMALAHLADEASVTSIDPPEDTLQAKQSARFYPIARDNILSRFPWSFATQRGSLVVASGITPPINWLNAYAFPINALRVLEVTDPINTDNNLTGGWPFIVEISGAQRVVYTNADSAVARFIFSQTDTTMYSIEFINALSYELAGLLAGPITRDRNVAQAMTQQAEIGLAQARIADANSRYSPSRTESVPSAIAARK